MSSALKPLDLITSSGLFMSIDCYCITKHSAFQESLYTNSLSIQLYDTLIGSMKALQKERELLFQCKYGTISQKYYENIIKHVYSFQTKTV
jgi:hypothetical protein